MATETTRISAAGLGVGDAGELGQALALPLTGATLRLWVLLLDLVALLAGVVMVVRGRRVASHVAAVTRGL